MLCVTADGSGQVVLSSEPPPDCTQALLLSTADYDRLRNPFNATPQFSVVLWSFGAVLLLWAVGLSVGMVISVVRKLPR